MISKLKLYENVVIGNFLYGLGFAVRAKSDGRTVPSMINLLQQTPADKRLGDVLLEFPGILRLLEFKQRSNKSNKEKTKIAQLNAAIDEDENKMELTKLSRSVHWFIETAPEKQSFISRIVPYLDAYPRDKQRHDLGQFIEEIAENAVDPQPEFSPEDLQHYLSLVATFQGSGDIGTGGLLFIISAEGSLTYAVLTDFLQLRLQHRDYIKELANQMQQRSEQEEYEEKLKNERRNKGPSL